MYKSKIENLLYNYTFTSYENSKILNDKGAYLSVIKINTMKLMEHLDKCIKNLNFNKIDTVKLAIGDSKKFIKNKMFRILNRNLRVKDLEKILLSRKEKINESEEFYLFLTSNDYSQMQGSISKIKEVLVNRDHCFLSATQVRDLGYFYRQGHKYVGLGNSGVQFLTKENDYFHFQSFSSDQATWINAICGSDKKLRNDFANELNLNLCLSNMGLRIPYITTIDIDGSGESYFNTLYSSVEEDNQKKLNKYYLGEKNVNINPFDIYFNTKTPSILERQTICKMLDVILDITEHETIKDELYNEIIEKLYNVKKYYIKGKCKKIDDVLSTIDITNEKISWSKLCEIFFENHLDELAFLAHKNSMPVINDIIDLFEMKKIKRANYFLEKYNINTKLKRLVEIYPYFNKVTNIDMKNEDTLVIYSLQNIPSAINELPYLLLALYDFKKKAIINKIAKQVDSKLYKNDINRCYEPSRICLNDVHKVKNGAQVLNFMMMESRKYTIDITLTCNNVKNIIGENHFYITSLFFVGGLDEENKDYLIKNNYIHNVSELLINKKENETYIFTVFDTIHGIKSQPLIWQSSPIQYWTYTSDFYEIKLKDKLSAVWTGEKIRATLAKKYPQGLSTNFLSYNKIDEIFDNLLSEM